METDEAKLRIRSNDGKTMVVETLAGEIAFSYIAETPEELEKLAFFPAGSEITCGMQFDPDQSVYHVYFNAISEIE